MGRKEIHIVGIMLVRNEDLYVERAVRSVISFCDRLLVANHESRDGTRKILSDLSGQFGNLEVVDISCPSESHQLVAHYAGSRCWVFAVDGDEIYDPNGLSKLRWRLATGEFDAYWQVFGNVLNCVQVNWDAAEARGYLAPPCRSMTKLFNFQAIDAWTGDCPERLHGGDICFRPGYTGQSRCYMHERSAWEESDFRCLHVCFVRRSSLDVPQRGVRKNIMEKIEEAQGARWFTRWRRLWPGRTVSSQMYKRQKYMRGELVVKDISAFQGTERHTGAEVITS